MHAAPPPDQWAPPQAPQHQRAWAPGYFLGDNSVRRPSRKARRRVHRRERRLGR